MTAPLTRRVNGSPVDEEVLMLAHDQWEDDHRRVTRTLRVNPLTPRVTDRFLPVDVITARRRDIAWYKRARLTEYLYDLTEQV